jgi:hypothetical protein
MEEFQTIWSKRIKLANHYYKEWEDLFRCKELNDYYEGKQWKNVPSDYRPYTVNYYYSTIKDKLATFLFSRPKYNLGPRPGSAEYDIEFAATTTQLKEDVLNNLIRNPDSYFKEELELAFLDSMFRFGMLEVGYGANWITNPNAQTPLLSSERNPEVELEKDRILKQAPELPESERVYFKRIPANTFRVGGITHSHLKRCSWVGYYDYVEKSQILKFPNLKNKKEVLNGAASHLNIEQQSAMFREEFLTTEMVKIWHIWVPKEKIRYLIMDSPTKELWSTPYDRLPLFDLKWDKRLKGWYPMPPSFQWTSPQNEINESREMMRDYRRRFVQKFQAQEGSIDDEEKDKFENGPSGTVVMVKRVDAIQPIKIPTVGNVDLTTAITSKDDLNIISGTSADQRGQAARETATASQIKEVHANKRIDKESEEILDWMRRIGREALLLARDKFTLGVWVEQTSDIAENLLGEVQDKGASYQYVSSEDLDDGYDFKIDLDVVSMSPIKAEEEKRKFLEFLAVLNSYPQIALSPKLIRTTAYLSGFRNESIIKELQQMALIAMMGLGEQSGAGNAIAQRSVAQSTPNTQEEIRQQLDGQLVQ